MMHAQSERACRHARHAVRLLPSLASVTIMLAAAAIAPAEECFEWQRMEPEGRFGHRVVWDTRRDVMVLFGGSSDYRVLATSDTWEWNGRRWRLAATEGPPPRRAFDMAFDERRGVIVLFGGEGEEGEPTFGDTWEWDGRSWMQRHVEGPSPRTRHAMAYDADRGVTVLSGGYTQDGTRETWEWDGREWTLRYNGPQQPGVYHRMIYDQKRRVVVSSGYELWEWDGNVWTLREAPGPAERVGHAFVYDPQRGVCILVGGNPWNERPLQEMWEWDGERWTELDAPPFEPRWYPDAVFDPVHGRLVLFGGRGVLYGEVERNASDLWQYSDGGWERLRGTAAPGGLLAYDSARGITVAITAMEGRYIWEWNGRQWRLRQVANEKSLSIHGVAYDPHLKEILGVSYQYPLQLWSWRRPYWRAYTVTNAQSVGPGGPMTYDEARGVAVIVGSDGRTWEWRDRQDRLELRSSQGPAWATGMTFDSRRGVSVLFNPRFQDVGATWEWDGQSWTLGSREGPGDVDGYGMTFDTRRSHTVMFGGKRRGEGDLNEVWRWDGRQWAQLEVTGTNRPTPGSSRGFVYDQRRDVFVACRGGNTWELTPVVCCDDVDTLATRCRKDRLVATLHLLTSELNGHRVTLMADGHWADTKIHGTRARVKFPRIEGKVDIELATPSGCQQRWPVECR